MKCKVCDKEFEYKSGRGLTCYKCAYNKQKNSGKYDSEYFRVKAANRKKLKENLLTHDECFKWISKQIDNKFYTDLRGLSELILIYESLGGLITEIDNMSSGEQLQEMWNFSFNKFKEKYPFFDINI